MTRRSVTFDAMSVMQFVVAVFLITLGLMGIIDWNRSMYRYFGRANEAFNIFLGIVELAAGVIVGIALFIRMQGRLVYWVTIIIGIIWIVLIFLGIAEGPFEPVYWLNRLAADVIILLAIWMINRKYA